MQNGDKSHSYTDPPNCSAVPALIGLIAKNALDEATSTSRFVQVAVQVGSCVGAQPQTEGECNQTDTNTNPESQEPSPEEQEAIKTRLNAVLSRQCNQFCADCCTRDPTWASINLGVFICVNCAGVHRTLGPTISKVRSVALDIWNAHDVDYMEQWGNERAHAHFEACVPASVTRPVDPCTRDERMAWISSKYERLAFVSTEATPAHRPSVWTSPERFPELCNPVTRVACLLVHGLSNVDHKFAETMIKKLKADFNKHLEPLVRAPTPELVCHTVFWAPLLSSEEEVLLRRLLPDGQLKQRKLRRTMMDYTALITRYNVATNPAFYVSVHNYFALAMRHLAETAGPTAPLCVVAHGFGCIIASNYLYDLQKNALHPDLQPMVGDSPLERGATLQYFYTLGCPFPLLAMINGPERPLDSPLQVPSPNSGLRAMPGEWLNFYCKADVLSFPLRTLSPSYKSVVTQDIKTREGRLTTWNSSVHLQYMRDSNVIRPIATRLATCWLFMNEASCEMRPNSKLRTVSEVHTAAPPERKTIGDAIKSSFAGRTASPSLCADSPVLRRASVSES